MSLSWQGRAVVDGLKLRIENSYDTDDLQEMIDTVIPTLMEKAPGNTEISNLERLAKVRIKELNKRTSD